MNVQYNQTKTRNLYATAGFPAKNITALIVQNQIINQDSDEFYRTYVATPEIKNIFEAQKRGA